MLPELLFSVGSSMQDISREEFSILNGGCDKDVTATVRVTPPISSTPPTMAGGFHNRSDSPVSTSVATSHLDVVSIKLEDNGTEIYTPSWHHPHHHHSEIGSSKLLLRNSDDPLISRGATTVDDDNPNELNPIVAAADSVSLQDTNGMMKSRSASATAVHPKKTKNSSSSTPRPRRKGVFKLRFHHQALPAEYLNHYEATQNQINKNHNNNNSNNNNNNNESNYKKNQESTVNRQQNNTTHDTVRSWLKKISEIQTEANSAKDTKEIMNEDVYTENATIPMNAIGSRKSPRRVLNYSDLPYMGEMTLENSKPRRGRKPKKADICHLIYKNYGTIFPGTPKDLMEGETKDCKTGNSLLEKRLVSDLKSKLTKEPTIRTGKSDEPLNLCLRDQSTDSVTISSDDENSEELIPSNRTSPILSPADAVTDALLAANLKMSLPNFQTAMLDKSSDEAQTPSTADSDQAVPPNFIYWPNAGVFINPMALYYQKMLDASKLSIPGAPAKVTPTKADTHSNSVKKSATPKIVPKNLSQLIKKERLEIPEPCSTPSSTKSNSSITMGSNSGGARPPPPQKRKRSAIFIPPMPAENTTNPATEVSICKFKFTGGAKPSLQEKKMLSVDSDGNYRYYSGTGDKSMRGYEFFPRESLQQSGGLPGVNCSGIFTAGEKISHDLPPPSIGLSNELLQIPDSPPNTLMLPHSHNSSLTGSAEYPHILTASSAQASDRRKRKSRRSLQREKLEKTFKEKGFLIQTQQLESAEGATYCKFRQLRKFTRYLFRSWKDYLPDDIQQANAAAAAAAASAAATQQQTQARNALQSSDHMSLTEKSRLE